MAALAETALFSEVMPWLAALLGLVVVGAIVIAIIRRRFRREDDSGVPFTLDDLRRLHAAGHITDEEFERARTQMIEALRPRRPETATSEPPETAPEPPSDA